MIDTPAHPVESASVDLFEWLQEIVEQEPEPFHGRLRNPRLHQVVDQLLDHLGVMSIDGRFGEVSVLSAIDGFMIDLDQQLAHWLGAITQHPDFEHLQSHWFGLSHLAEAAEGDARVEIDFLSTTKEQLLEDFSEYQFSESGLFLQLHTKEYDQAGGKPYTTLLLHFNFQNSAPDLALLAYLAQVSASCHAPAIGNLDLAFLGANSVLDLEKLDLVALHKESRYSRWKAFRLKEESRYIGLALPRFRVGFPPQMEWPQNRPRYCTLAPLQQAEWTWIPASYAFGLLLINSFREKGWCAHLRGPQGGGLVTQLPGLQMGTRHFHFQDSPLEVNISDRLEQQMASHGFITFIYPRYYELPCLYNAPSLQSRNAFNDNPAASLPYLYLVARFAHAQKVMQRDNIGSAKGPEDLERMLDKWLRDYISPTPSNPQVRIERPLKSGHVEVTMDPSDPGFYEVKLTIQPHLQMEGIDTRLSLASKLRR